MQRVRSGRGACGPQPGAYNRQRVYAPQRRNAEKTNCARRAAHLEPVVEHPDVQRNHRVLRYPVARQLERCGRGTGGLMGLGVVALVEKCKEVRSLERGWSTVVREPVSSHPHHPTTRSASPALRYCGRSPRYWYQSRPCAKTPRGPSSGSSTAGRRRCEGSATSNVGGHEVAFNERVG